MEAKREISGFFLSSEKFVSHVESLTSPDCTTRHLRLFHNEPHHSAAVVQALARNASVTSLDIYELDSAAASTLASVLSSQMPPITSLALHHLHDHEAVCHLARGLSFSHNLKHLHFSRLDARGVTAVADALAAWAAPATTTIPTPTSSSSSTCLPSVSPGAISSAQQANGSIQEERGQQHPQHGNAPRLQQLRLEKCKINVSAATALAAALGPQAAALNRLEVVESGLEDAAAAALFGAPGWVALRDAHSLGCLDLTSCSIGAQGAALLGSFLGACRSLHTLSLANNKTMGCAGASALLEGMSRSASLTRLDLSNCGIAAAGVQALAAALRPKAAAAADDGGVPPPPPPPLPLHHLALSGNSAGAAGLLSLLRAMSGAEPCRLRTLQLDRNHIRGLELAEALGVTAPKPVTAAAPAAAAATAVPDGAAVAGLPLVTAPLEQLSLAGNALYDAGVTALAACLAAAPCLEQLDLRENGIADAGVTALLPLVAATRSAPGGVPAGVTAAPSPGLQGLLLDGNRIHNTGAQVLLAAVTAAPGLWRFSVEANKTTDPGLRLSLTQLGQHRAARHSQLVVLGRQYSSSSSSSASDDAARRGSGGGGPGSRRGPGVGAGVGNDGDTASSGGGGKSGGPGSAGGGGGGSNDASGGGGAGGGGKHQERGASPMDMEGGPQAAGSFTGLGHPYGHASSPEMRYGPSSPQKDLPYALQPQPQQQQQLQYPKHRLEERQGGLEGSGSGDDERCHHQTARNVAARGPAAAEGCSGGGGHEPLDPHAGWYVGGSASSCCLDRSSLGDPSSSSFTSSSVAASSGNSSGGSSGGSSDCCGSLRSSESPFAAATRQQQQKQHPSNRPLEQYTIQHLQQGQRHGPLPVVLGTSPPPAMCFVTAVSPATAAPNGGHGVSASDCTAGCGGDVGSVGGACKGVSWEGESAHPAPAAQQNKMASTPPQQILPAYRKPRYKPLTPEQQRLFEDF